MKKINFVVLVIIAISILGIEKGLADIFPSRPINFWCASGAGSVTDISHRAIADIASNSKPAILIPLKNSANDHQGRNAYELAKIGGALVLEEMNLKEHIFLQKIEKILDDKELQKSMGEKIGAFYHPEASEKLAKSLIELAS